jgi:hypothetical protein
VVAAPVIIETHRAEPGVTVQLHPVPSFGTEVASTPLSLFVVCGRKTLSPDATRTWGSSCLSSGLVRVVPVPPPVIRDVYPGYCLSAVAAEFLGDGD